MKKLAFFIFSLLLFSSCEPHYYIDFVIKNKSEHSLRVYHKARFSPNTPPQIQFLEPNTEVIIHNINGSGYYSEDKLLTMNKVEIDTIHISIQNTSTTCTKNWRNIKNWWLIVPNNGSSQGTIQFDVTNEDF